MNAFGTDSHKLHRAGDPDTSKEAAEGVDTTAMEETVLNLIKRFPDGCISDDIREMPELAGMPYSTVTARYKALLEKGLIHDTGERRRGNSGRNMRVMKFGPDPSGQPKDQGGTNAGLPTTSDLQAKIKFLEEQLAYARDAAIATRNALKRAVPSYNPPPFQWETSS
jgi:DNA-binding transcriptional ArsR family regulator